MTSNNPVLSVAEADYRDTLVKINHAGIAALTAPQGLRLLEVDLGEAQFAQDIYAAAEYFLIMDTLNYQFWDIREGEFIRYQHNGSVGALAMQAGFQDLYAELYAQYSGSDAYGIPAALVAALRTRGIAKVFGDMPAADSRLRVLSDMLAFPAKLRTEINVLVTGMSFGALSWQHAQRLAEAFPVAYGDRYLKKAQLTLIFLAGYMRKYRGVDLALDISICADYQLPKVLRNLNLIEYSAELAEKVDSRIILAEGGPEERAIRAATVLACEALAKQFGCKIEELDNWLWLNRNAGEPKPFHLTFTTNY